MLRLLTLLMTMFSDITYPPKGAEKKLKNVQRSDNWVEVHKPSSALCQSFYSNADGARALMMNNWTTY
jgi:hypothetical protein